MSRFYSKSIMTMFTLFTCVTISAQVTITGSVHDARNTIPLAGANIAVVSTGAATFSNEKGLFSLQINQPPPLSIVVSFTGYRSEEIQINNNEKELNITLHPAISELSEVVVSASRRPEKLQEAPAAIGIIKSQKISADVVGNPFLSLRNMVGVDVGQAGVNSGMITLRGSSSVFQTETFVMADYRNLVLPGLGTLGYSQQPIDQIDLAKIEVVKGPGSALYGPGVESGIVHFISKNPIDYPGTSVSMGGGSRSSFETAIRHAATNDSKTFGYKILALYRTAQDWELDPNDPIDSAHLASYQNVVVSSLTGDTVFMKVPDYNTESVGVTATVEYRPGPKTSLTGVAGWSLGKYIYRTAQGEGYVDAPRPFAQVRFRSGGFFAQAFWSYYDGRDGNTGLYSTGKTTVQQSNQLEGQLQYNFAAFSNRVKLTSGADYRLNTVDSRGTVNGRYENDDKFLIVGGYLQGDAQLSHKLNLVAAGRIDRFNALKETSFSPRIGLIYKAAANHTFRATFNHAVSAPTTINLFGDLALLDAGAYFAHLLGGAQPVSFNNPQTTSFLPGNSVYNGVGQSLSPVYAVLTAAIARSGALPKQLTDYLLTLGPDIPGVSAGIQSMAPRTREKLKLSTSNMFEVGYKGNFSKRLNITLDAYYNIRKNLLSAPIQASPVVVQPTLGADLSAAVAATVDPIELAKYSLTPGQVAAIYQNAANGIAKDGNGNFKPLGVIRSDQTSPSSAKPTIDLAYYNITEIKYGGIDLAAEYSLTRDLSASGSISWLSDNLFKEVPVGKDKHSAMTDFSLNVSDTKIKGGIQYHPALGFNGSISARYQSKWDAINGALFTGHVDAFTMVDVSIGYQFKKGLSVNATCTNLFQEDYRFIYGAPVIGRQAMVRLTYSCGK